MDTALEIILSVVMIGTACAFGGVVPEAYSSMEIVLFFALFLLLWKQTRLGQVRLWLPIWPMLFVAWIVLQLVPIPASWFAGSYPLRGIDARLTGLWPSGWTWETISIYPHDTALALMKFLAYLSAFILAAQLFDSRKKRSKLIGALILLGFFEAAYGLVQYLTGWQKIFTYTKVFFTAEATGTYINRNHFAGILELTLPFAVAKAFHSFQGHSSSESARSPGGSRTDRGSESTTSQALFYLFLAAIMFVGLTFSRSRAGILSMVISLVFITLLGYMRLQKKRWTLSLLFITVLVVGYGLWIGMGPVLFRFESTVGSTGIAPESRIAIFDDARHLVARHPVFGTGLGTFNLAIREYQTTNVNAEIPHAHDDYLEVLSETGIPGGLLLFAPAFYLFLRMTYSFLDDPGRFRRAVTLGCVGSILAMLVHSAIDFNLQIPANALVFAVVLGVGYKAACVERRLPEVHIAREIMAVSAGMN